MRHISKKLIFSALLLPFACVSSRPARNGVFNENQYVRKDFLIAGLDSSGKATNDPGWIFRATVTEVSTPNMLGGTGGFDVWGGLQGSVDWVRFRVTQDKLEMISRRQFSNPVNPDGKPDPTSVTDNVVNVWPVTNVDLKYQVNLDGETTNFYQENQELDWQLRQWVKINFARNDFSDLQPLGIYVTDLASKCADVGDASATLVDGSLKIEGDKDADLTNDYMEFTVQILLPLKADDPACIAAYGAQLDSAARLDRTNVTVNLKYSLARATPTEALTYKPFKILEKDDIHTKYGPFIYTTFNRDPVSELIAADQYVGRFDPMKPIVWYFDVNFPDKYKKFFNDTNGIKDATNSLLEQAGVPARVDFQEWNAGGSERSYGDVRYNFLRWASDQDLQDSFAGVTMPGFDPRTGEIVNEGIEFNDFAVKDYYVQRINAFLLSVGAADPLNAYCTADADCSSGKCGSDKFCEWPTGMCTNGDQQQIVTQVMIAEHNAKSSLFTKMQQYLHVHGPDPKADHIGPQDLIYPQDDDFRKAYYAILPYEVFADPDMNLFVTREGGAGVYGPAGVWKHLNDEADFHALARKMDQGLAPYDSVDGPDGITNAVAFANKMRDVTTSHMEFERMKMFVHKGVHRDAPSAFSLESVMLKDSRRCVGGQLESREDWVQGIIDSYWQQVFWHEFGHSMGLEHNFMASIDRPNFPDPTMDSKGVAHYPLFSSSVMEYNSAPDRLFWTPQWGKYDKGAISWIYANDTRQPPDATKDAVAHMNKPASGQVDAMYPYKDPNGFDSTGAERHFLRCDEYHLRYSPLCRQGDLGTTPSEIIANAIDSYEWTYQWRNFRNYRKVWNNAFYADGVVAPIIDMHRFLSVWGFDWSSGELATLLHRVGIVPPANAPSAQNYYAQLTQKFNSELSQTNQIIAAFHKALIQQASGERPFATVYDKFYGDEVQQGIILDKYFAMQNWVGLWIGDNYDQNQSAGAYISSWGDFGEPSYASVSEDAVTSMIGSQYAVYPYFIPTAVALFAQDTHNPAFSGRIDARDWIGGQVFYRERDLIDYFRTIAVQSGGPQPASGLPPCLSFDSCTFDVTDPTQTHMDPVTQQFTGPDGLQYIYAYVPGRNVFVVARKDRNIATFKIVHDYNVDIFGNKDDGSGGTYFLELPIKYTIDAFKTFD